jgi:hypothetical protein
MSLDAHTPGGKQDWQPAADTDLLDQRDLWAAIILIFWCIWLQRNDVVFNGASPALSTIKTKIKEEFEW